jgi:hypothetical protein
MAQQIGIGLPDAAGGIRQVECVDGDIAHIRHLQAGEGCGTRCDVEGAEQAAFSSDGARAEARSRTP